MQHKLKIVAGVLFAAIAGSAHASDVNVGVSLSGEVAPGVYGRVDIGNTRPVLVYQQPMVIVREARPVRPVYMHVPPGHAKNWGKHCHRYDACGVPVYFVKSAEYEPRRHRHDDGHHYRGKDRDHHDGHHGRGKDRDHHDGHHGRGHGKGHGEGHGKGKHHD
ncbi:hypothetical protein [Noviherbaspirillum aridicola]|uniref:Uncharacterized protein n=1 Tax=Noviherbaspirillum aridicola TaxID=2849687 RepID=A0ABQ4Q3G0_9BURK|nr:hypothetical protein [Noviherbaspirillum aridicola]GIZ51728.1 hypothetical protein NCCP691_17420 [Noviherbaspirillum aridicola]